MDCSTSGEMFPRMKDKEVSAMTAYEIIYDFSDDYTDERNISEMF